MSFSETIRMARTARPGAGGLLMILSLSLLCGLSRAQTPADTLSGRVLNGTTNQPVPNLPVTYVIMQQGLEPVATAVTGADGRFVLEGVGTPGGAPALLRAEFQGVTYSLPVLGQQPGGVQLQVFEAASQPEMVSVKDHLIFLHPVGDVIFVTEQVVLENTTAPPKTYFNPQGTYRFALSETPRAEVRLSVTGPGGMPIQQTPEPGEQENHFALGYPIRPGETQVRIDYSFGYQSPFDFTKLLLLPSEQTFVIAPGTDVQLSGEGVAEVGTDPSTGFTGYQVTPRENLIRVQVSGQAPASVAGAGGAPGEGSGLLTQISTPVNNRRRLILGFAGLVMLLGFFYHYTHAPISGNEKRAAGGRSAKK
ncbi:MAG: hypothetical protein IH846_01490 [Acidobacteria bacterium]|nr:hypothetical protein [Acidobacteriota bacterium]